MDQRVIFCSYRQRRKKNSCRLLPNIKKKIHENNMIAVVEEKQL